MVLWSACDRRLWLLLLAWWEEFEQHEESMGQLQQQNQQLQQFQETEVNNAVNPRPPLATHQVNPTVDESVLGQRTVPVQRRPPLLGSMPTSYALSPIQTKTGDSVDQKVCKPHWLKQMTNRAHVTISSMLGQSVRCYDNLTPPGLCNPGQNVCFLNAIIQAIAHTPCLPEAVLELRRRNPVDQLVWHLGQLLEQLAAPVTTHVPLVLDTSDFRKQAYFEFPGGLIQPQQRQQDAAECLCWIVEWLHSRMNTVSLRGTVMSSVQPFGI